MAKSTSSEGASTVWTPLYRTDLETLLNVTDYTKTHLSLLYWLIWFSLLSREELFQLLAITGEEKGPTQTRNDLTTHLKLMIKRGLIDVVTLREPSLGRQHRYYATDLGLYLYLSTVRSSPPLSIARLARSYPVERDDLLARLARPSLHLACTALATRLIAEGEPDGYHLVSYQQPWQQRYTLSGKQHLLISDAALLIRHHPSETDYAFLVHVDHGPHQRTERVVEQWVISLLDLRQGMRLYRQNWPDLLIISTRDRLRTWSQILMESSLTRTTRPLSGGITTLDAMKEGVYTTIWYDLVQLAATPHPDQVSRIPFAHLLRHPASAELVEQFSHQRHFYEVLLKDAAAPPPRTKRRLTRSVGDSLQQEASHLTRERLTELFAHTRKSRESIEGAGLLTLALTAMEKDILTWIARHPLLDLPTLQAVLRPEADPHAIKPLQQQITRLFTLGLLETRLWPKGKTALDQQRYLLTPVALKFLAIRHGEPFGYYFVAPKYRKGTDEQLDRQWGTRGLSGQMHHTHGLYTFMRQLYRTTHRRGEIISSWRSAHDAARWYRDTISQEAEHTRPDAELVFALSPQDDQATMVLLEYDRGTTGEYEYTRKFQAYLEYQQFSGKRLMLLIVTSSDKAIQRMQRVLDELHGSLRVLIVMESDLLSQGLALLLHHFPPEDASAIYLGYWGADGELITFTVTVTTAGSYRLSFHYGAGNGSDVRTVQINGDSNSTLTFPGTGSWSNWSTVNTTANLQAGSNSITLSYSSAAGSRTYLHQSGFSGSESSSRMIQDHNEVDLQYFTAEREMDPLHGVSDAISGGNAVYHYSGGGFPTRSYGASND